MTQDTQEQVVLTYATNVAVWVNRADIQRVAPSEMDSPAIRIRVVKDSENRMAVIREDMQVWLFADETQANDAVIFQVDQLMYGVNQKIDATALSGIKRYFENVETIYYAVSRNGDSLTLLALKTMRQDGVARFYKTGDTFSVITDVTTWIAAWIARANKNQPTMDQRKEKFNEIKTAYGHYRDQNAADRSYRKVNAKK